METATGTVRRGTNLFRALYVQRVRVSFTLLRIVNVLPQIRNQLLRIQVQMKASPLINSYKFGHDVIRRFIVCGVCGRQQSTLYLGSTRSMYPVEARRSRNFYSTRGWCEWPAIQKTCHLTAHQVQADRTVSAMPCSVVWGCSPWEAVISLYLVYSMTRNITTTLTFRSRQTRRTSKERPFRGVSSIQYHGCRSPSRQTST